MALTRSNLTSRVAASFQDYFWWLLRSAVNQGFPPLVTLYLTYSGQSAVVAESAVAFAISAAAALLRSGAIQQPLDVHRTDRLTELLHSLVWAALLLVPALLGGIGYMAMALIVGCVASASGVLTARLTGAHLFARAARLEILSFLVASVFVFYFFGPTLSSIVVVLIGREIIYLSLLFLFERPWGGASEPGCGLDLRYYFRSKFARSMFWVLPAWKDLALAATAYSLFPREVYGAFHAAMLYWGLPVLVLGAISRINLRVLESNPAERHSVHVLMWAVILLGGLALALVQYFVPLGLSYSPYLFAAAGMVLLLTPPVAIASMQLALANAFWPIIIQNVLWVLVPLAIYILNPNRTVETLALGAICAAMSSLYIVTCAKKYK